MTSKRRPPVGGIGSNQHQTVGASRATPATGRVASFHASSDPTVDDIRCEVGRIMCERWSGEFWQLGREQGAAVEPLADLLAAVGCHEHAHALRAGVAGAGLELVDGAAGDIDMDLLAAARSRLRDGEPELHTVHLAARHIEELDGARQLRRLLVAVGEPDLAHTVEVTIDDYWADELRAEHGE